MYANTKVIRLLSAQDVFPEPNQYSLWATVPLTLLQFHNGLLTLSHSYFAGLPLFCGFSPFFHHRMACESTLLSISTELFKGMFNNQESKDTDAIFIKIFIPLSWLNRAIFLWTLKKCPMPPCIPVTLGNEWTCAMQIWLTAPTYPGLPDPCNCAPLSWSCCILFTI